MPASNIPHRPMVQGSDKSSPPVRITVPWPSASTTKKEASTISEL